MSDTRLAALVFAVCSAILLLGAAVGLNVWPTHDIRVFWSGTSADAFWGFTGFGAVSCLLFWGSRPPLPLQRAALAAWPIVAFALYRVLDGNLESGWIGKHELAILSPLVFLYTSFALACALALLLRLLRPPRGHDPAFERDLRWLSAMVLLFLLIPPSALSLTATLHPLTFDRVALRFEDAAGLGLGPLIAHGVPAVPGLDQLLRLCYRFTPLGMLAVCLLQLRGRPAHLPSGLLLWVALSTCGMLAYHFLPITGPLYAFGPARFLEVIRSAAIEPAELVYVAPYARNGMPSLHFGWMLAATILWWRSATRTPTRLLLLAATLCTALETLRSGEHYLIDLVVAVPFVLACIGLCARNIAWERRERHGLVILGFGTWFAWVWLLRTRVDFFIDHPAACWLLIAATAAVVVQQARWMRRHAPLATTANPQATETGTATRALELRFAAMFFLSGAAALAYQVLFAKKLALVFGSTATATFTVLATFLGGMALGSLVGGALAHRTRHALRAYALIELGIAAYCLLTPAAFDAIQSAYVGLASGMPPSDPMLLVLRVVMGALVLVVPTAMMGATLPLLAQALGPASGRMGIRVAWLYFANTAGASLGALLTAYFVIPALGAYKTTVFAAVLNVAVALAALSLGKAGRAVATGPQATDGAHPAPATALLRAAALAALGIGGALSLGLEVVYVHLLSIVAGNSVYAFGLMVATFLVGLALGGEAARRFLVRPGASAGDGLALSLLALCLAVALGTPMWNAIPDYFASYQGYPAAQTFASREAIRGLVCALVMVPPALWIGAAYAFAMDIATNAAARPKAILLGRAAAVNTAGNIVGVLVFGFALVPLLGGLRAAQLIAAVALALALTVWLAGGGRRPRFFGVAVVIALLSLGTTLRTGLDYDRLSSGANVYFSAVDWGRVVDHAESIDGGLTTVARAETPSGVQHTLLTNGKFQGNDANQGEMRAQVGFALATLLHQDKRGEALVIGYGTGVTSRVLHEAGFAKLDIAELSADVVRLADRYFSKANNHVSRAPGVQMHLTDGRNFLLLSGKRYDVISIEITSIWFAGASALYNREFYRLARSRMAADGVLQQWLQLHRLAATDILTIVATLRSEFRYVSLYVIGSQGILIASNDARRAEPSAAAVDLLAGEPRLAELLRVSARKPQEMASERVLDAAGVDRFVTRFGRDPALWIATDDNLLLEYSTPKANVNDGAASYAANIRLLSRFAEETPQAR